MKKIKLWLLASKIEWHWWFILRIRRKGNSLLSEGVPLTSQKLHKLNQKLSMHSTKAKKAELAYSILSQDLSGQSTEAKNTESASSLLVKSVK